MKRGLGTGREANIMTKTIHKKIVVNENNKPVEVIISYDAWKEIERILESGQQGMGREKLKEYAGIVHLEEEPLEYQRRMRSEWK
jgi:PHD/YefM family antitoxin component YafN of YafNO toxin-antitoxin module